MSTLEVGTAREDPTVRGKEFRNHAVGCRPERDRPGLVGADFEVSATHLDPYPLQGRRRHCLRRACVCVQRGLFLSGPQDCTPAAEERNLVPCFCGGGSETFWDDRCIPEQVHRYVMYINHIYDDMGSRLSSACLYGVLFPLGGPSKASIAKCNHENRTTERRRKREPQNR